MTVEKKPGLYLMPWFGSKVQIDVYRGDSDDEWYWGKGSDCGNPLSDDTWNELEYVGPTTGAYLANVRALTELEYRD